MPSSSSGKRRSLEIWVPPTSIHRFESGFGPWPVRSKPRRSADHSRHARTRHRQPEVIVKVIIPGSHSLRAIRQHFVDLQTGTADPWKQTFSTTGSWDARPLRSSLATGTWTWTNYSAGLVSSGIAAGRARSWSTKSFSRCHREPLRTDSCRPCVISHRRRYSRLGIDTPWRSTRMSRTPTCILSSKTPSAKIANGSISVR